MTRSFVTSLLVTSTYGSMTLLDRPLAMPFTSSPGFFDSLRHAVGTYFAMMGQAPSNGLVIFVLLIVFVALTRSVRRAVVGMFLFVLVLVTAKMVSIVGYVDATLVSAAIISGVTVFVMVRYGVWAFAVMSFFNLSDALAYLSFDFGRWFAFAPIIKWTVTICVAAWATRQLLAAREYR